MNESAKSSPLARIKRFFVSNPWLGALSSVAGIISVPLAVYLYVSSKELPDIRYYVHPVRSVIAQAGSVSDLSVLYKNEAIPGNVTSASVAIWNSGNKPVTSHDVLTPLLLTLEGGHRILEAKLVTETRSVVQLQLDPTRLSVGMVGLQFRILEHNDGGVIQVIYQGDSTVKIGLQGAVVGQATPTSVVYAGTLRTLNEQYRRASYLRWAISSIALLAIVFYILQWFTVPRPSAATFIMVVVILGMCGYLLYSTWIPTIPFVF